MSPGIIGIFFLFTHIGGAWTLRTPILSLCIKLIDQSCDTEGELCMSLGYWFPKLPIWLRESIAVFAKHTGPEPHLWTFWFKKSWGGAWQLGNSEHSPKWWLFFSTEDKTATLSGNIFFTQLHYCILELPSLLNSLSCSTGTTLPNLHLQLHVAFNRKSMHFTD